MYMIPSIVRDVSAMLVASTTYMYRYKSVINISIGSKSNLGLNIYNVES